MILLCTPTSDIPNDWHPFLKRLTVPDYWALSLWLHHDGSTYATIVFDGATLTPNRIVGWACLTFEDFSEPAIGVFVDPEHRGNGYASRAVSLLLQTHKTAIEDSGGSVRAQRELWHQYPRLIAGAGLRHVDWGQ